MKNKFLKLIALALSIVTIMCCAITAVTCSAAVVTDGTAFYALGDANKDKSVNILDFICIKRYLAEEEVNMLAAAIDFDSDGEVSASDVISIKKHLLGINDSFDIDDSAWDTDIK